ncbi:MAG: ABC transporter ATP-binding protein [Thermoleophilia bacterium]
MSPLLEVNDLDVFYGDFQALYGVSLEVQEGETFAIIGANGAGKSTFLKAVAGLLPAGAGSVKYEGDCIQNLATHERVARGIALVPEGRRVFPSLTVHENLQVGGYSGRQGDWNLDRIYELFPLLVKLRNRPAGALSGGEQQALAIGRALMANPKLLLLDEVSLGLAPVVVKSLYEALGEITSTGATVLIVEQDIGQVTQVADRLTCFLEGRVALAGRPDEFTQTEITEAYFGVKT